MLWPALRAFAGKLMHSSADAEDAAQEGLVKVFARISQYDRTRDALTWAYAVTAFEVKTLRRRQKRRGEARLSEAPDTPSGAKSPEEVTSDHQATALLRAALSELSPEDAAELHRDLDVEAGSRVPMNPAARKRRQRAVGRLRLVWRMLNGFHS